MAEFVRSLLGCEEHAKCFKKEVRNAQTVCVSVLLAPEALCFHFLKWNQAQLGGQERGVEAGQSPAVHSAQRGRPPALSRFHVAVLCHGHKLWGSARGARSRNRLLGRRIDEHVD